ncbi:Piso0_002003 [Millerozyma farinosa CBS 7064]|uniref:Piso0_002003 protein n=1 Tax=Pichia sorbitophila (strain ATCC MYA-4447 / BCRC 22081 / CBS 7064 / NBRC 10061 / NRRL Y-12695) TaxID=559304 RepID=G8YM99_PICSO|nr:Piso0_002003 [Millerozyma farinosa CBS 7064]
MFGNSHSRPIAISLGLVVTVLATILLLRQPAYHKDPAPSLRNLEWRDINFVHTTDTHGWYSGHLNQKQYQADWGNFISFTTHLREIAHAKGQDLLLVDSGDRHDGNGLSDATKPNGAKSLPIFIQQDYDILTIGNHELYEFENSKAEYEIVAKHYNSNYICSNVEYEVSEGVFKSIGRKYKYFTTPMKGIRILALGFLFDFRRNNDHTRVKPISQVIEESWINDLFSEFTPDKVDLIVINGHIPVSHDWEELQTLHAFIRRFYPSTKIQYFGGHSHIRDFAVYDDKSTGLQSGRFCETVGWLGINTNVSQSSSNSEVKNTFTRSYIDFNLHSFMHHTGITSFEKFTTPKGEHVSRQIKKARYELGLETVVGQVNSNYYMDYVSITHPKSIFKLLSDKILPTLKPTNDSIELSSERIIIINTGSIRYDLYKGPFTLDTEYIVSPFRNNWVKITVPKKYAVGVTNVLNGGGYILNKEVDNLHLLPPQQRSSRSITPKILDGSRNPSQKVFQSPELSYSINEGVVSERKQLTKGYVTHDDFGDDGDDTPHRAVVTHKVPNVIESTCLDQNSSDDTPTDLIFYDFIIPNIIWALHELGFEAEKSQVSFFSSDYLGKLLHEYARNDKF